MKLLQIEIENIASVKSFQLDFTQEPIASSRVFLICGEMGTGKTTLLDSICLALYGTTPRLEQAGRERLDYGEKNEISSKDPRHLLRRGAKSAYVKLVFENDEGICYTATWSVSRNRNGNLNLAERSLTDGNQVFTKDIQTAVNQAVGLDFDQFCRTTMLAQGQFTQFLKSPDDKKSEILEKLTNTGIYGEVGAMVATLTSEKKKAYEDQHSKVQGFQLLSAEELAQLKAQIAEEEIQIQERKKVWEEAKQKHEWLQHFNQLSDKVKKLEIRKEDARRKQEEPIVLEEKHLVKDWRLSTQAVEWKRLLEEDERKLKDLQERTGKGRQLLQELLNGTAFERKKIADLHQQKKDVELQLQEEHPRKALYEQFQVIKEKLDNAANKIKENAENQSVLTEKQEQLPQLEKQVEELRSKCTQTEELVKKQNGVIADKELELKSLNQEGLLAESQKLKQEISQLNEAENLAQRLESVMQLHQAVAVELQELQQKIKDKNTEKQQFAEELQRCQESYNQAKSLFDAAKLRVGDEARFLRSQLKKGDTCPVCGHQIQQDLLEEELHKLFEPYEKDLQEKETALTAVNSSLLATEKLLHQYKDDDYPKKFKEKEIAEKQQNIVYQSLIEICKTVSYPQVLTAEIEAVNLLKLWLQEQLQSKQQQSETNEQKLNEVVAKQQQWSELKNQLTDLLERKGKLEGECAEQTKIKDSHLLTVKHLTEQIEKTKKESDMLVKEVDVLMQGTEWQEAWRHNPHTFVSALGDKVLYYNSLIQKKENLLKQVETTEQALERVVDSEEKVRAIWPEWLDIQSNEEIEIQDLEKEWGRLAMAASNLRTQLDNVQQDKQAREKDLQSFLAQHPDISAERLAQMLVYSISQIDAIEQKHKQMQEELQSLGGALAGKQQELEQHTAKKPQSILPEDTEEVLAQQDKQYGNEYQQMVEICARKKGALEVDEKNREKVAVEAKKEEEMKADSEYWSQLNTLFGKDGGKAFRNIAQSCLLGNLLVGANAYLQQLDKRYQLDHVPGTLTISLRDCYQPGVQSPVAGLSGGESFLVSLSLALALSAVSKKGLNIDTLFIDEGFGTLGSGEIDRVVSLLERLQETRGKRVGIISHINYLRDRIPVHIEASRIDSSSSQLRVVDTTR